MWGTNVILVLSFAVYAPALAQAPAPGIRVDFNCQNSDGYHAISNECDTYILCEENAAYKVSCPDGLHFNSKAKYPEYACDYSPKVQCASGAIEQPPNPTNQCPRQFGFYPMSDGECSKYMWCHGGIAAVMKCPPGLVFNPQENSCDWLENVPRCIANAFRSFTCPEPPKEADGSISGLIYTFRYNNVCNAFVACHKGYPRLLKCDAGKSYDDASQACVDSAYVKNCEVHN